MNTYNVQYNGFKFELALTVELAEILYNDKTRQFILKSKFRGVPKRINTDIFVLSNKNISHFTVRRDK